MNVEFTDRAIRRLENIRDYIAERNPAAADTVIIRLLQTIEHLALFPLLGRSGEVEDTREFSVPGLPYIIVYQLLSKTQLVILTFIHAKEQYPAD